MYKQFLTTEPEGFPIELDKFLKWQQEAYSNSIDAIASIFGNMAILTGVVDVGGGIVSSGWIAINGEIIYFEGGAVDEHFYIETITDNLIYQGGTPKPVLITKKAVFGTAASQYVYADLVRVKSVNEQPFNPDSLVASAKALQRLANLTFTENTVITKGCIISNLNTIASTLDISTGEILMNGKFMITPAYSGSYPCYLKENGTYDTALPGAGLYITFDPYTSQRKEDVLIRATFKSGELKYINKAAWLSRFDVADSGLGKWEFFGWKICDDIRGRVPVGYDRRTLDPADGVWDVAYNNIGNVIDSNSKHLNKANLPAEGVGYRDRYYPENFNGANNILNKELMPLNYNIKAGSSGTDYDNIHFLYIDSTTSNLGDGVPFDIRQPSRTILIIERI
ncbi:MAG: hypothetical protein JSR11_03570 [Bacteroidetes bacterium]|nr:hypothetical protein [Bacteroidota bacterium]